jgi:hypothetical protein
VSFTVKVVVQDGPPSIETVIVVWPTPTSVPAVGDWEMPVQSPGLTLASTFGTAAWQFPSAAADVGAGQEMDEHCAAATRPAPKEAIDRAAVRMGIHGLNGRLPSRIFRPVYAGCWLSGLRRVKHLMRLHESDGRSVG